MKNKTKSVETIREKLQYSLFIVRSSSRMEDTCKMSNAGKFLSVLNVPAENEQLMQAIERVISSYENKFEEEILVQPMLENIIMSGVAFTADMDTYSPYYVINYEDGSGDEGVTSRKGDNLRTFIAYKNAPVKIMNFVIFSIIDACRKIEKFLDNPFLDIEFAMDSSHKLYIFQVRPIAKGYKKDCKLLNIEKPLNKIYKKITKLS